MSSMLELMLKLFCHCWSKVRSNAIEAKTPVPVWYECCWSCDLYKHIPLLHTPWEHVDRDFKPLRGNWGHALTKPSSVFVSFSKGVKKGDRVSIYLPMIPELVCIMLACARIGAVHSIVVSSIMNQCFIDANDKSLTLILVTQMSGVCCMTVLFHTFIPLAISFVRIFADSQPAC